VETIRPSHREPAKTRRLQAPDYALRATSRLAEALAKAAGLQTPGKTLEKMCTEARNLEAGANLPASLLPADRFSAAVARHIR